jgi:dTDP-glucose 4,6-dehydratase
VTRTLVTGAAGFIGSNFVDHLLARADADRVVGLDVLSYAGRLENLDAALRDTRFRFVKADINDEETVHDLLVREDIATIVHFAAESHVDRSISGPAPFIASNIDGTYRLLEAARRAWSGGGGAWREGCRFHHVSTDEVFGSLGPDDPAFSETTPYAPNSPYSASKAASDHLVRAWHHTFGLPVTISNCSNNYGPRQFPEKLLPLMILNCLHGRALPVYGAGLNVRDWLHVGDHCAGIELVLRRGQPGETYNIGTDNEWRNIDLVRALCGQVDVLFAERGDLAARFPACPAARGDTCESLISSVTDRPGHDLRYAIDAAKIAGLGFTAQRSFLLGLRETIAWYVDNEAWWGPLIAAGKD